MMGIRGSTDPVLELHFLIFRFSWNDRRRRLRASINRITGQNIAIYAWPAYVDSRHLFISRCVGETEKKLIGFDGDSGDRILPKTAEQITIHIHTLRVARIHPSTSGGSLIGLIISSNHSTTSNDRMEWINLRETSPTIFNLLWGESVATRRHRALAMCVAHHRFGISFDRMEPKRPILIVSVSGHGVEFTAAP